MTPGAWSRRSGRGVRVSSGRSPSDVAIDAFSNLYVADEDQGIFVFSPKGELMTTFGASDVKKSRAVAIDLTGAALVYDDRTETIVRFK